MLEDISPFSWGLFWTSGDVSSGFQSRGIYIIHSQRFTSRVIPTDLLVTNMVAKPFSSTYLWTGIAGAQNWDLSCCRCSQCEHPLLLPSAMKLGQGSHTLGGGVEGSGQGGVYRPTPGGLQAHTWGCVSQYAMMQTPPSRRILLQAVRILLECILVLKPFSFLKYLLSANVMHFNDWTE